jgi:hypothetical protein
MNPHYEALLADARSLGIDRVEREECAGSDA